MIRQSGLTEEEFLGESRIRRPQKDCGIAGLITLTKQAIITTKVPIPRQLYFSFIIILFIFFIKKVFLKK